MNRLFKIITLVAISSLSISGLHASYSSDPAGPVDIVSLHQDDGSLGERHRPHKAPAKNDTLPDVYYNSNSNSITLASSSSLSFHYYIYNPDGNIDNSSEVQLDTNNMSETITVSSQIAGDYTIVIEINGQSYFGNFYVE